MTSSPGVLALCCCVIPFLALAAFTKDGCTTYEQKGSSLLQVNTKMTKGPKVHSDEAHTTVQATRYLDLVRDTITGTILRTPSVNTSGGFQGNETSMGHSPYHEKTRWKGGDWCANCFSMAGGARVQNVRELVEKTIVEGIPGDFLEAGTWRGGCSIMARVVQRTMGEDVQRHTYVCDSFSGLPKSSQSADDDSWSKEHFLEVAQSEVEDNFKQFHALDSNVKFRRGYFAETLPSVRRELKQGGRRLAVLRGDGDMYESYMDILYNLYDLVSVGGYFICDDCPGITVAQRAIDDFRVQNNIVEQIHKINGSAAGTFWRKETSRPVDYGKYLKWNVTRTFKVDASSEQSSQKAH